MLLLRFAVDFSQGMNWRLSAPFWLLVIVALSVGVTNLMAAPRAEWLTAHRPVRDGKRALLLGAIPLAVLASSLGCMGLRLLGCSPFCTFIKLVWIPLIAAACGAHFFTGKEGWLTTIAAMAFMLLVPHCVCYNVGNAWWIDRIGASPVCYSWGFTVSIISIGALRKGSALWPSLLVCFAIIAGATGFFVSHHYFHFPW